MKTAFIRRTNIYEDALKQVGRPVRVWFGPHGDDDLFIGTIWEHRDVTGVLTAVSPEGDLTVTDAAGERHTFNGYIDGVSFLDER